MTQVARAISQTPRDLPLFFASKKASIEDLRHDAQHVIATTGRPLGALIIDRFELLDEMKRDGERNKNASYTSAVLAGLAKELNTVIICLVQLNRKCEERPNKRPILSDLRDSGSLEQDATRVIGVYRDEVYNEQTKDKGIAELLVLKNMHGQIGTVRIAARMEFPTFDDLGRTQEPDVYKPKPAAAKPPPEPHWQDRETEEAFL
jgi:replicative DNA helicase